MYNDNLREHKLAFLADATPILQESLIDFVAWQRRSPTERDQLTRLLHDSEVGEDWTEEDVWADVFFSPEEIEAFSTHIRVAGDDGQPEWYKTPLTSSSAQPDDQADNLEAPPSLSVDNFLFTANPSRL